MALSGDQQNVVYNRQLAYLLYIFPTYPLLTIKNVFDACSCMVGTAYHVLENHTHTVTRERARATAELNERPWLSSYVYTPSSFKSGSSLSSPMNSFSLVGSYPSCDIMSANPSVHSGTEASHPIPASTDGMHVSELEIAGVNAGEHDLVTLWSDAQLSSSANQGIADSDLDAGALTSVVSCIQVSGEAERDEKLVETLESEQTTNEAAAALMELTINSAASHTSC